MDFFGQGKNEQKQRGYKERERDRQGGTNIGNRNREMDTKKRALGVEREGEGQVLETEQTGDEMAGDQERER